MVAKGMDVRVYGKDGCGKCDAAKDKLKKFGIPYQERMLADVIEHHDGWRDDNAVDIMACYADSGTMPVIVIDGAAHTYPETMKRLKEMRSNQQPQVLPVAQQVAAPAAQEAAAV